MTRKKEYFKRFSLPQRIEHWIMVVSFSALAITGLPQKFVGAGWAESMIAALGGIENVRIWHRYAAIILIVMSAYHLLVVAYKVFVERVGLSMMPVKKDVTDAFYTFYYNLGFTKKRPKMPRYNFVEKAEYWAFIWGTIIMILTGFVLWNPIAAAQFMPGSFIPAAKAAHGGEALLAFLAILVWHFYSVHVHFNKSMFTGKLSRDKMEHEHALELEAIENGTERPAPAPESVAKRRRVFIPVGTVVALVMLAAIYWFVTFEDTAIATVPPATESSESFQPLEVSENSNHHVVIEEYTGPESCTASGCHNGDVLQTAQNSLHNQRIAVAGPNPLLAKMVLADASPDATEPDCLVCHASEYNPDDLLASAQTVRATGGQNCERCHSGHPEDDVHNQVGLACVGCHTSNNHQIQAQVSCTNCHDSMPHNNPIINVKHQRISCKSCHINAPMEITVNTEQASQNPVTGFFEPLLEIAETESQFTWQTKDGAPADVNNEQAKIVPIIPASVLAPSEFDPVDYAATGQVSATAGETAIVISPGHGVIEEGARTCETCHGPEASFNFAALGFDEEQVDKLSAKPAEPEAMK